MTLFSPVANYLGIHHRDLVCGETPPHEKHFFRRGARSKWQLARISGAARYTQQQQTSTRRILSKLQRVRTRRHSVVHSREIRSVFLRQYCENTRVYRGEGALAFRPRLAGTF
ncbi:hypothetical protein ALC56_05281 [Trachymyrmex septentrionalis]|uniref:Uncharacterized protein n=1 Tax=Trachymyrmex septentrionalis TaxID=34720 RepID=A0A195FIY8_9HYME|nr:hypothetical protein ALC56_05281 [Trachymyrmex septentrionalis]